MKAHLAYLRYVLWHKWFVLMEGLKIGVPVLSLLLHDWDKFLPDEWFPYVNFFYGKNENPARQVGETGYFKPTDTGDQRFDFAWLLHQKRNRHHWQFWILPKDEGGLKVLQMNTKAALEMIADWRGAGKAQGTPDTLAWYRKNRGKMALHPDTRFLVETYLKYER